MPLPQIRGARSSTGHRPTPAPGRAPALADVEWRVSAATRFRKSHRLAPDQESGKLQRCAQALSRCQELISLRREVRAQRRPHADRTLACLFGETRLVIAVQLYTVRAQLQDPSRLGGVLARLREIGYGAVEVAGL